MTKRLSLAGVIVAVCLMAASGALATPIPIGPVAVGVQPHAIPVPASVQAAYPNGHPGGVTAVAVVQAPGLGVAPAAGERLNCWRAYFTNDNSPYVGTEQEWINPYWCGNGTAMRGLDNSWHGQTCTILVACGGEDGIGTWWGCANYCASLGQQIDGHFAVNIGVTTLHTTLTIIYQLYPNGDYWSYNVNA